MITPGPPVASAAAASSGIEAENQGNGQSLLFICCYVWLEKLLQPRRLSEEVTGPRIRSG
jgi:hypothetical protein